jgi:succinoglycan biosynthesis transport protein ExoP
VNHTPRYSTLRDYLAVLRQQAWLILLITFVATAGAYFVSTMQEARYEATAGISFQDEARQLSILGSGSLQGSIPPGQTPQARAETIERPEVVKVVKRKLGSDLSVAQLQAAISSSLDKSTLLVRVTGTWGNGEFAAELANEFSRAVTDVTNDQRRKELEAAAARVEDRLDAVGSGLAGITERQNLISQLNRLEFLADNVSAATVVEVADAPGAPVSPQPRRNAALALLLGLVIGVVVAFVRDSLDRRLHGIAEVQDHVPFPLLGQVRDESMGRTVRFNSGTGYNHLFEEDLESFRIIRQNLQFLAVDSPTKVVLITSPLPEEGKSTAAASLACASAAAGKSTLLVECDLRRPALAARLKLSPTPGLTDYLAGQVSPREILQTVDIDPLLAPRSENGAGPPPRSEHLRPLVCITAGSPSPQPAELLQSERFKTFISQVGRAYDAVVIDTSPLLPVVDTLEIIPHVDAVLMCVRSSQTTREQVLAATAALEILPERPTGLIVTGLKRSDGSDYGYEAYGYGYQYAAARMNAMAAAHAGDHTISSTGEESGKTVLPEDPSGTGTPDVSDGVEAPVEPQDDVAPEASGGEAGEVSDKDERGPIGLRSLLRGERRADRSDSRR